MFAFFAQGKPMGKIATLGFGCVLGIGAFGAPAVAQELIDGKKPKAIEAILKGFGIARLETDSEGDPKISGRTDGKAYTVHFYNCTDNKDCSSIQFWTYWDEEATLDKVNEWNKDTRFGKLYIDGDNDVILEYDVNLLGGISEKTLEDDADVWVTLISRVESKVFAR